MPPLKDLSLQRCNCTICFKKGFIHMIVPAAKFALDADVDADVWTGRQYQPHPCATERGRVEEKTIVVSLAMLRTLS